MAEVTPQPVNPADNPQVEDPPSTTVPVSAIDVSPAPVTEDPEVTEFSQAQEEAEFVSVSSVDLSPGDVTADPQIVTSTSTPVAGSDVVNDPTIVTAVDPQLPGQQPLFVSQLIEPSTPADESQIPVIELGPTITELYPEPEVPTADSVVLAQARLTATDVALVDITTTPDPVDQDVDPNTGQPGPVVGGGFFGEPPPTSPTYAAVFNVETGTYDVIDVATGQVAESGLSQARAEQIAVSENAAGDPAYPEPPAPAVIEETSLLREPTEADVAAASFVETNAGFFELQEEAAAQPDQFGFVQADDNFFVLQEEIENQIDQTQFEDQLVQFDVPLTDIVNEPEPVSLDEQYQDEPEGTIVDLNTGERVTAGQAQADAARAQALVNNARNQQAIRDQRRNNPDSADWRVRIRLAPNATYLYNASDPGILAPLQVSDGVIFPYTPIINTVYKADYSSYNLTHSNYRGFFYQSSYVEDINITGTFTAQDTREAEYLLAVIHFFRSATKMFYGQDSQRGAPPPLVYLSAFGQYQYVDAPCVISQFNYNLPADVDYIRARSPNQDGTNLLKKRDRQAIPTNPFLAVLERLKNARSGGLPPGAEAKRPPPPSLGLNSPTYVPTKMEITLVLHPMQSRKQVSQQFSLKDYSSGRLQPRGYW